MIADEKMPMVAKALIWIWGGLILWGFLKAMIGPETPNYNFISWNEFYYDLLAKGEVCVFLK